MKSLLTGILALSLTAQACAQINLNKTIGDVKKSTDKVINGDSKDALSNEEVIRGLREALSRGAELSATSASKADGFFRNPAIKIPFPEEAIKVKNTAESIGLKNEVDQFVLTLNRAAEEASKEAAPVFIEAIKSMSVGDGFAILRGGDDAATRYLRDKTTAQLTEKFKPIVQRAIQKVELTRYWNPVISGYNRVPGVQKMNPDLEAYITEKTIEGLFYLVAQEELKIRQDPAARVTDLLRKVFG